MHERAYEGKSLGGKKLATGADTNKNRTHSVEFCLGKIREVGTEQDMKASPRFSPSAYSDPSPSMYLPLVPDRTPAMSSRKPSRAALPPLSSLGPSLDLSLFN